MKSTTSLLPSFRTLARESWQETKDILGRYLLFSFLGWIVAVALLLLAALMLLGPLFALSALSSITSPGTLVSAGVVSVVMFVAAFVSIGVAYGNLPNMIALFPEERSFSTLVLWSIRRVPAVVLLGLCSLATFGGWFFFFIPGIIWSLYFRYAYFQILEGKSVRTAFRRGASLWQFHSGRLFSLSVIPAIAMMVFNAVYQSIFELLGAAWTHGSTALSIALLPVFAVLGIGSIILTWVFAVFIVVYSIRLYRAADETTPKNHQPKFKKIILATTLGWILLAVIIFSVVRFFPSDVFNRVASALHEQTDDEIRAPIVISDERAQALAQEVAQEVNIQRHNQDAADARVDDVLCRYIEEKVFPAAQVDDFNAASISALLNSAQNNKVYFTRYRNIFQTVYWKPSPKDTASYIVSYLTRGPNNEDPSSESPLLNATTRAMCVRANTGSVQVVVAQ